MKIMVFKRSQLSAPPKHFFSKLILLVFLQSALGLGAYAQDPTLPPSGNFDLSDWKITLEDQTEVQEDDLSNGFERPAQFFTDPNTGAK